MDNVLTDMVQRLRAIELLLRTQNELLSKMIAEWNRSDHPTLALEQARSSNFQQNRVTPGGRPRKVPALWRPVTGGAKG